MAGPFSTDRFNVGVGHLLSIPFKKPHVGDQEYDYIKQALESGAIAGPGHFSKACEALVRRKVGAPLALIVPSCTAAIEMSALVAGIKANDEVIMPSYTFVSNPNAAALRGAVPVFVDVDPTSFNITLETIEAAITDKTRAIFVTHYAGVVADMPRILEIARAHDLVVVEDAAQAYGSTLNGQQAGSFAPLSCFSYHDTKNIVGGEAGGWVVNDKDLASEAEIIREKGTDRSRFLRGHVDFYTWQGIGSSQIVSEMTAAFLCAQLERADEINAVRKTQWAFYQEALSDMAKAGHFDLPNPPAACDHNAHIFYVVLPDSAARSNLVEYLKCKGVTAQPHYVPLHNSPAGQRLGRVVGSMENTIKAADRLLRLPLFHDIGSGQETVVSAISDWVAASRPRLRA